LFYIQGQVIFISVKQVIKRLASWGLQDDINSALKYKFRNHIQSLGRSGKISSIYDIGAHHGNWALGVRRVLPQATFHLFEANNLCEPYLARSGLPFSLVALSSKTEKRVFFSADSTGDSFYRENSTLSGVSAWREREITARDLDSYVKENGLQYPDMIKLDVQGAELDILAGGNLVFSKAKYLLVECPLAAYNEGAPGFSDYLNALASSGFSPSSIVEMHHILQKDGVNLLCQIDLFFERHQG